MHTNVTIKNVSWPHFSWATLYIYHVVSKTFWSRYPDGNTSYSVKKNFYAPRNV